MEAVTADPAKSTAQIGRELGMDAEDVERIKRERQMEISDRIDGITPGMRASMDARAEAGIATTEERMAARATSKAEDADRNEMLLAIGYNVYRNSPSILTEVESLRKMMRLVFIKLGEMSLDNMMKNMQEEWTKKDTD